MKQFLILTLLLASCLAVHADEKKLLRAAITVDEQTKPATSFSADVPKLWAVFINDGMTAGDNLRGAWIAEDVVGTPKNTKIIESTVTIPAVDKQAAFTLSKPTNGWPVGKYRVEMYLGEKLAETVNFTIVAKSAEKTSDVTPSAAPANAPEFGFYQYLSTEFQGDGKVLDVVNDGAGNNQLTLAKKEDVSGQLWKVAPLGGGYYRLTTQWRGDEYSLDVVNDGKKNNQLQLAKTGDVGGQKWKITAQKDGYSRLTTEWRGDGFSLDVVNAGKDSNSLVLSPSGNVSGQAWKFQKSSTPTK